MKESLSKESFDQYAIDKIALMHQLNLPEKDMINLLVGGIIHNSVRITTLSVRADTIEAFLDQMRQITEGLSNLEKKPQFTSAKQQKQKDDSCRNCGRKKGHTHLECRSQLMCFFCKAKRHRQYDCPEAKKKEVREVQSVKAQQTVAATTNKDDTPTAKTVATGKGPGK